MAAIIISADEIKKSLKDYDPKKSHLVHRQSTKLADKEFVEAVKSSAYKTVVLLSGGSASGKTEFVSEYLVNQDLIIFDGTLPSFEGAKIKIDFAKKHGKNIRISAIWPDDIKVAFAAFLSRDRKYPDEYFYKTHIDSRQALLEIVLSKNTAPITIYRNFFDQSGISYREMSFQNRKSLIDYLQTNQYTQRELLDTIANINDWKTSTQT